MESREDKSIFETAVIMHNQIGEDRRDYYSGDEARGLSAKLFEDEDESDIFLHSVTSNEIPSLALTTNDIKLQGYHRKLTRALVDHIWCMHGKGLKTFRKLVGQAFCSQLKWPIIVYSHLFEPIKVVVETTLIDSFSAEL